MEHVHTALRDLLQNQGTQTEARCESRLLDACLAAGMSFNEPCVETWALNACTKDLLTA